MTDPIADMLTRMRNALRVKKAEVLMPVSKFKVKMAEILKAEGYVNSFSINDNTKELKIVLKYLPSGKAAITSLQKISKPGRRVYTAADQLPRVLNNLGIAIISTSQGLMTSRNARSKKIGGEIICQIY